MPKGKTWDKIKNAGKKAEALGRDIRDSVKEFFDRDDVKTKLKSIETEFRALRDKVSDHFKAKANKADAENYLNNMQKSIDELKTSKPEDFEASCNKISELMKSLDSEVPKAEESNTDIPQSNLEEVPIIGDNSTFTSETPDL